MFSVIRKRITYANVAMTLALVFAMTGGALAAGKYLITSTKQISPKVLKALQGKAGKPGTNGTNGASGAQGPAGTNGKDGTNGKEGTNGKDGTSVTSSPASVGECPSGGTTFTAANGTGKVCNGTTGFTETLPSGKTEKGAWAYSLVLEGNVGQQVPISFNIPLSKELEASKVHYILANGEEWDFATQKGVTSTACLGTVAEPKATKGNLCVYAESLGSGQEGLQVPAPERIANPSGTLEAAGIIEGAGKTGAILAFTGAKFKIGYGTWAVTAE